MSEWLDLQLGDLCHNKTGRLVKVTAVIDDGTQFTVTDTSGAYYFVNPGGYATKDHHNDVISKLDTVCDDACSYYIYRHTGAGHYDGSCVIVTSTSYELACKAIRKKLDSENLESEELDITEYPINCSQCIYTDNGDC